MKRTAIAIIFFLISGVALATRWAPSEKTDPLTGEKVPAREIMSYGSYIYYWPSKYDLVFWPFTDENWICFNPKNGYIAFNNDFEELSAEEKKNLADWLKENYKPDNPPFAYEDKLDWLEKVYGQRKMDDDFWCYFYRLMAYVNRYDEKISLSYVKKAVPLLEQKLKTNPEGVNRLEVLYLLGEYYRRLGNRNLAQEYFSKIRDVKYKDEDGKEKVGHPYFVELVEDRRKLMAGESSNQPDAGDGK